MTNPNENVKSFDKDEEVLAKVNGGTDISEFSDLVIESWIRDFGQPDGSFKFVCPNCSTVITGAELGSFYDDVYAHYQTHMKDFHFDNIPLPRPGDPGTH